MNMHEQLRAFLEANGLPAAASESEAWEYHKQLAVEGVAFNGPMFATAEPEAAATAAAPETAVAEARADLPEGLNPCTLDEVRQMVDEAIRRDRERVQEIQGLCRYAGITEIQQRHFIESRATVDAVRKQVLAHLMRNTAPVGAAATTSRVSVGTEDGEKFRAAAIDGIMLQLGRQPAKDKPLAAGANEFRSLSPMGLARLCLERAGVNTSMMSKYDIAKRALIAHSTSDFPTLLGGIGRESLAQGYAESAVQTWRAFSQTTTAADFRDMYTYDFTGAFDLRLVRENAEYETVDASESGQKYRIAKYGRVFPYTFEMLTNDRWGLFATIPRRFGAGAVRKENDVVYDALTGTTLTLSDGTPVFDPTRGNIVTPGTALSEQTLKEAILMLRAQRGENGEYLDLQPAILLVSPMDEFTAAVLVNSTGNVGAQLNAGVVNPLYGVVRVISDPRIPDGAWYLFAAPSQAALIEVAWLDGNQTPFIDEEVDFITDGIRVKCRHCFGAGLLGWRGAIYNPGPNSNPAP